MGAGFQLLLLYSRTGSAANFLSATSSNTGQNFTDAACLPHSKPTRFPCSDLTLRTGLRSAGLLMSANGSSTLSTIDNLPWFFARCRQIIESELRVYPCIVQ